MSNFKHFLVFLCVSQFCLEMINGTNILFFFCFELWNFLSKFMFYFLNLHDHLWLKLSMLLNNFWNIPFIPLLDLHDCLSTMILNFHNVITFMTLLFIALLQFFVKICGKFLNHNFRFSNNNFYLFLNKFEKLIDLRRVSIILSGISNISLRFDSLIFL